MRHRKRGRHLGRTSSHRKALLKNLASALFLTERDVDPDIEENAPKVKGRIVTTLEKAREVRPLVEKCITIACRSLQAQAEARQYATSAERNSEEWKRWRTSPQWQSWAQAMGPVVTARRRVLQLIGDKQAVRVLFGDIAPRFEQRDGGYTRILRLANRVWVTPASARSWSWSAAMSGSSRLAKSPSLMSRSRHRGSRMLTNLART